MLLDCRAMSTSLVENTRKRLVKYHGRYPDIGREAELSYSWLTKFAQGRAKNPTMRNLEPLIAVLDRLDEQRKQVQAAELEAGG